MLERLIKYENDVLEFMVENDWRMTKVQQKISGCFRSMMGAKISCRIQSYISTCRKHDMTATDALKILFNGQLPTFITED